MPRRSTRARTSSSVCRSKRSGRFRRCTQRRSSRRRRSSRNSSRVSRRRGSQRRRTTSRRVGCRNTNTGRFRRCTRNHDHFLASPPPLSYRTHVAMPTSVFAGNNSNRILDIASAYSGRNVQLKDIRDKIQQGANAAASVARNTAHDVSSAFTGLFE